MTLDDVKIAIERAETDYSSNPNRNLRHCIDMEIRDKKITILCDGQGHGDLINYGLPYNLIVKYNDADHRYLVSWWEHKHPHGGIVLPPIHSPDYGVRKVNVQLKTDHNTFNFHFAIK